MKCAQLHSYDEGFKNGNFLTIEETTWPKIARPHEVLVKVAGAGLCRTDLHIISGMMKPFMGPLPAVLGHENAGYVQDVGDAVTTVKPGDPVLVYPVHTDGLCLSCRRGDDVHCRSAAFIGFNKPGGFAQAMIVSERSLLKLPAGLKPEAVAPYTDAGLTAYRAVDLIRTKLRPGMTAAVVGFGGVGHIAAQILRRVTSAEIIIVDKSERALTLAEELGFSKRVLADNGIVENVKRMSENTGVDVVLDFVGDGKTPESGLSMLRSGGVYSIIGYGGTVQVPTMSMVAADRSIVGSLMGSYTDLVEVMAMVEREQIRLSIKEYRLEEINEALHELLQERFVGRIVVTPN